MTKPSITLTSVSKTFLIPHERRDTLKENFLRFFHKKNYEKFNALEAIDLQIMPGDFLGIVGKNGSGKSTLLKIIAGIYMPSNGKVKVQGHIAQFLELGIGFQPELTARENIYVNATLLGMDRKEINKKFKEIIQFAEIENFLDLKIKNYSSGMKARLAFSIAKEADADIYLCDEVLAVGDEQFQQKCLEVFKVWKQQGKTIILVSHNASLIEQFCNQAILLEHGKIIINDKPQKVVDYYHKALNLP